MKTQTHYTIATTVRLPHDEAVARVKEALHDHGFGILSEVDVREVLERKIEVDFRPYVILGVCNPGFAHQALTRELEAGALLPCNVIVYEGDEPGTSEVAALDPEVALSLAANDALAGIARDIRTLLDKAISEAGRV